MADPQKSEKATPRRLLKAREEGNFPSAKEMVGAVQFLVFVALLGSHAGDWLSDIRVMTRIILQQAFRPDLTPARVRDLAFWIISEHLMPLVKMGAILLLVTLGIQLAVTKFGLSLKKVMPDFSRLNPAGRLRQLPRQNIPALIQAAILLPLFGYAVYLITRERLNEFYLLPLRNVSSGAMLLAHSVQELLWRGASAFLVLGLVNMFRQRTHYSSDLKMSKQEIKDESKEQDGSPLIRQRVRRLQREMRRRHMMKDVATATAVVVNPTHFAVAIRYQMEESGAPKVVAKGKNHLALRIRQLALEHQVPIIENPPLAQALYKSVEVGQEIPAHLYRAVAEILAYIYRLMHGRAPGK